MIPSALELPIDASAPLWRERAASSPAPLTVAQLRVRDARERHEVVPQTIDWPYSSLQVEIEEAIARRVDGVRSGGGRRGDPLPDGEVHPCKLNHPELGQ
jgi:hypothetical protein